MRSSGKPKSEILRAEPRVLRYLGERSRAGFFAVVKTERVIGPAGTLQLSMGTDPVS
jgi:hypothetical protein